MKKLLLGSVLALSLSASSCLGPNRLFNTLNNWNAEMSDQDWFNEGVYLLFWLVPVYQISLWVDVLVFNTIGYWADNPVMTDPGPFPGFGFGDGAESEAASE